MSLKETLQSLSITVNKLIDLATTIINQNEIPENNNISNDIRNINEVFNLDKTPTQIIPKETDHIKFSAMRKARIQMEQQYLEKLRQEGKLPPNN